MAFDPPRLPRTLGRFRIDGRLGAGGMGEVYRAYDERLARRVAIKVIRRQSAEDSGARERFRREARAAAALDHPATVKIHEILADDDGDAIVMELVDGTTLAEVVRRGPLAPERAVRLGIEIAEGLAAAHALGIVHRDLKSENVMVTPAGHARILDFGLAKRCGDDDGGAALSRDGAVFGTYRTMSPEQARGLPVDHRSDLFSLGTLLYEALTGESPFLAATPLATLTAVCAARQAAAGALRPGIPQALSNLVDHLLEKEPAHRPQTAREVAAALAAVLDPGAPATATAPADDAPTVVDAPALPPGLAASLPASPGAREGGAAPPDPSPPLGAPPGAPATAVRRGSWASGGRHRRALSAAFEVIAYRRGAVVALPALALLAGLAAWSALERQGRDEQPLAVAVLAPQVDAAGAIAGSPGAEILSSSARAALQRGLLALRGISVIAPEQVDPVAGSPVEVARATAADELMTASLVCAAGRCEVALARLRGTDGKRLWAYAFEAAAEDPFQIAHAVESRIHLAYPSHAAREGFPHLEAGAADYREYLEINRDFAQRRAAVPAGELLARLDAVRRRSPRFLEAKLLAAEVLRYRFRDHRDGADVERAFDLLGEARRLAPADPYPLASDFSLSLEAERLDRAAADLAILERLQPGDPGVLSKRARLLERRGATVPALALLREACRRRSSWANFMALADMEYRLGESAAARQDLEQLLRRAPGFYQAQSLLAQIELLSGSPARAAALYEDLLRRSPQESEMINLGLAHMLLRRYPQAEARFRQALALEPENPFVTLNLADVCLLEGRGAAAMDLYRRLLLLAARDPAAAHWQLVSVRAQALAHRGPRLPAVEAAQSVLALAPGNAQAKAEVAVVYAVIGDHASALWNAGQALRQGVDPRWFSFPWFDDLRASPELRPLLAAAAPPA